MSVLPGPQGEATQQGISSSAARSLVALARPYRRKFVAIALLSAIATGLGLLQPLVYRMAINDVAGVFVYHTHRRVQRLGAAGPDTTQLHTRTHVAARTGSQAFKTLMLAVVFLFFPDILRAFARQLRQNGKKEEAYHAFRALLEAAPDDKEARKALGHLSRPVEAGDEEAREGR